MSAMAGAYAHVNSPDQPWAAGWKFARASLAPLYVMAYRYGDAVHRFVINGQTGKATGTAPRSTKKLLMVVGFVAIAQVAAMYSVFSQVK